MIKPIGRFKLSYWTVMRNKRIPRKRALVEYSLAIMKRVFHFSYTLVTLSRRVKFMFSCFSYNLLALNIIKG
ncbi:MAG: hypothetical protein QXV17_10635 [Candidatus Micrarchaeaceae archaeon]